MKPLAWRFAALASLLLISVAWSATRPHYGGILRIQLLSPVGTLDGEDGEHVLAMTGDTLVTSDGKGNALPRLATEWQHDAGFRKWRFRLRPGIVFHDGSRLTAGDAVESLAASLRLAYPGVSVATVGDQIAIETPQPSALLLSELALPRHAIVKRPAPNQVVGTGPFRLALYQPGTRVTCTAFDEYWGGRPFIDSVEITGTQGERGAADITELPVNTPTRQLPERTRLWTSAPVELMAIVMPETSAAVREAIGLSLDRGPIVSVLTQKRGEAAYSLLPEWVSGYAFVFASKPDRERARHAAASSNTAVTVGYPQGDVLARLIAERVVLNARETGLSVRLGAVGDATLRVTRIPLQADDAQLALHDIARQFGLEQRNDAAGPEALYNRERSMLAEGSLLPVVFVPEVFAIGPRVRNWDGAQAARSRWWQLENVWLAP